MEVKRVAVTGASGQLGRRVVQALVDENYEVIAIARSNNNNASSMPKLNGVQYRVCDICDMATLTTAMEGAQACVHTAAGTRGTRDEILKSTVDGTKNALHAAARVGITKFIYIGSCSVYQAANLPEGASITEQSELEPLSDIRGAYSEAKLKAEKLILREQQQPRFQVHSLRPGEIVYTPEQDIPKSVGIVLGNRLALTYKSDRRRVSAVKAQRVVNEIMCCLRNDDYPPIRNIVDVHSPTASSFLTNYSNLMKTKIKVIDLPLALFNVAVMLQGLLQSQDDRSPRASLYRLHTAFTSAVFKSDLDE